MSLFKSKDWWSSGTVLEESSADLLKGSLKISQIGPEGSGDVIILGSPSGLIQIFKPQGAYQPTDLVLEYMTDHPILQVETGKLMPGSTSEHIAVLHPRSVSVYMLSSKEGHTEYGDQNILLEQYDHKLSRSAYCFVIGPFGKVKDRDFICVQSLDGLLMFYEQDIATFSCFLPNFLLPGEISYSRCADIFITCNSNWIIDAFSYHNLSQISDNNNGKTNIKKPNPDWEYNVGENINSIQEIRASNNMCSFVLLGERCLYCLNDNGVLKFMKKFDFEPICSYAYLIGWYYENNARFMVMVISETSTLLIYEQVTLLWSCQLTFLPVRIDRGFFTNLSGSVVMLTDYGEVKCSYLGTEPELFTAPPLPSTDMNFEEAQEELEKLQTVINSQSDISEIKVTNTVSEKEMPFTISINNIFEVNENMPVHENELTKFVKCKVAVKINPLNTTNIELVQVTFITQNPLKCSNPNQILIDITDDMLIETEVYATDVQPIASLNIEVVILFTNSLGQIRVLKKQDELPFKMVYKLDHPQKDSKYKITLTTNKPTIDLLELFDDFSPEELSENGSSANVIAFSSPYCTDFPITIINAKSSQRYRIQCDSILPMGIIVKRFVYRLLMNFNKKPHLRDKNNLLLKISVHGGISNDILQSFLSSIEEHIILRQELVNVEESLETLSSQFILIQKRLMTKYRERPPSSCDGLNFLLEDTYSKINDNINNTQELRKNISSYGYQINCGLNLIFNLLDLTEPPIENLDNIKSALSINIFQDCHQAWEETATLNALYLLKTKYAKNEKERDKFVPFNEDSSIKNYSVKNVTKYLRLLLERVSRKQEISPVNDETIVEKEENQSFEEVNLSNNETVSEYNNDDVFRIPEGSLLGQRKLPK